MDAALFTKMLSDKSVLDLKKLGYKYPQADMGEFVSLLKNGFYHPLPLKDFSGQELVYLDSVAQVHLSAARILLTPQSSTQLYGAKAMEEEIISTFTIEQVDFSRDSVRKILSGFAPADESENRIYGMKKGLEFISDPANRITEASIHQLYETAIGAYLPEEDRLHPGSFYRHDSVYVVGSRVEHMFGERLILEIFAFEHIKEPTIDNTHANRIRLLKREGLIPKKIDDILYALRKTRNDAVHAGADSVEDAKTLLSMTYNFIS